MNHTLAQLNALIFVLALGCDPHMDGAIADGATSLRDAEADSARPPLNPADGGVEEDAGASPATPASEWIGIHVPSFGLDDSHAMYASRPDVTMGREGPYTHYVDNTSPTCSDAAPGTAEAPRCTIPTAVAAGSVVEVHGGPYALRTQVTTFTFDGTEDAPTFLRGIGDPEIDAGGGENRRWELTGAYFVVEGFRFVGGATARTRGEHYALRHSEVDFGERNCVSAGGSHGVLYDNHLHHCHRQPGDQDVHGVMLGVGSSYMWVLANHIHHNFGNGIQWGHGAEAERPDFVFIAGNVIHDDRETGIASKWSNRSVISQNTIFGYRPSRPGEEWCAEDGSYCNTPSSGSAGQAIVSGADGSPREEWIIYNRVYDTSICFRLESADRASYVGNVCTDSRAGLRLEKDGPATQVLHNTFYSVGEAGGPAIIAQDWRDNFRDMAFSNNVFLNPGAALLHFEDFTTVTPSMAWDRNYHYADGGPFGIVWRSGISIADTTDLAEAMAADTLSFDGNVVADPVLADPVGGDFRPAAGSPLEGAANDAIRALNADFQRTFGGEVSVIADCWADGIYDIGAICAE